MTDMKQLANQAAPDLALRARVADLLHLLQFAKIETPSAGDAAQAEIAMRELAHMLAAPTPPAQQPVAVPDGYRLLPVRITRPMIETALEAHYGKRRVRQAGGAAGVDMTANGINYNGIQALRRMWAGALAAAPTPPEGQRESPCTQPAQQPVAWRPFDYNAPPESGMYWIAGTRPEWDADADAEGRTVGRPTGEVEKFVSLVWLQTWRDDDGALVIDWSEVDDCNLGRVAEDDIVTHFMLCETPSLPDSVTAAPGDTAAPEQQPALGCDYRGSHFGASYPDAQCIDGYLWDEDSCDEPGGPLRNGGDIPCPKCNAAEYAKYLREIADGNEAAPEQAEQHSAWLEQVMEQAQVFASAWSLVGGPFDTGDGLKQAKEEKQRLREMLEAGQ